MPKEVPDFELSFFEGLVAKDPNFVDALIPLAEAYTRKGLYEQGLKIYRKLVRLRRSDPIAHYNLACSLALMGRKDESFRTLEKAIRLGYRDFDHLKKDPDFKSLREDPRFLKLVSQA